MFFLFPRLEHPAGWICARYKSLLLLLLLLLLSSYYQTWSCQYIVIWDFLRGEIHWHFLLVCVVKSHVEGPGIHRSSFVYFRKSWLVLLGIFVNIIIYSFYSAFQTINILCETMELIKLKNPSWQRLTNKHWRLKWATMTKSMAFWAFSPMYLSFTLQACTKYGNASWYPYLRRQTGFSFILLQRL